jgi:hypothetical protein
VMKIIALAGGILAAGALVLGPAGIALADGAPAPDPTSTAVPAPTATPDPTAPAAAPTPAPPVTPPVIAALTMAPADVVVTPPADPFVAVLWGEDTYGSKYGQHIIQIVHESTETLIALPTTCGAGFQSDVYVESAGLEALLDNGKGTLAGPDGAHDGSFLAPGGSGVAYVFAENDACPPPIPDGVTCTLTGTSYTEDVDWTSTAPGESLTGQTSAVDHYYGVTGNLQGLTVGMITETTSSTAGESALAVIEANPHGSAYPGGPVISYETLSPVGPDANGTTDELAGTWYTSKIPYGDAGGQGNPEPLSWFIAAQPNNSLISIGVHFQTNGVGTSVVSALNFGCVSESYAWPTVTLPGATYTPATCTAAATVTLPATTDGVTKYSLNADNTRPVAGTYSLPAGSGVDLTGPFTLHTLASAQVQPASVVFGPFTPESAIPAQSTNSDAPCYVAPPTATPTPTPGPTAAAKVLGYTGDSAAQVAQWNAEAWIGGAVLALGFVLMMIQLIRRGRKNAAN